MNYNKYFIALLSLFITIPQLSHAQNTRIEEQKKQINEVKKSDKYLYGEATLGDKQSAIDLAKELLYENINKWVSTQKKFATAEKMVTINTNYSIDELTLPRGNMFRAFMYVKKSDIIPATNVQTTDISAEQRRLASQTPDDTVTKPVKASNDEDPQKSLQENAVVKDLLRMTNTSELGALLKQRKQQGSILEYNKLSALQNPENYLMVIFNKEQKVEAVLSDGINRINLKSGAADSLQNYKGRGAIGVKIKK